MLVLSRKIGERILIGDSISVTVINLHRGNVRIGIDAPKDVTVHRQEVYDAIQRDRACRQAGKPTPAEAACDVPIDVRLQRSAQRTGSAQPCPLPEETGCDAHSDAGEKCDRCGNVGRDRRTLWMACLYDMHELDVPFKHVKLANSLYCEKVGEKTSGAFRTDVFEKPTGEPIGRRFYTLRVCKWCRSEWMRAIEQWFRDREVEPEC